MELEFSRRLSLRIAQEEEKRKAQLRQKYQKGQQKAQQRVAAKNQAEDDEWMNEIVDSVQSTQISGGEGFT